MSACVLVTGLDRRVLEGVIKTHHYTHSVPSGKSWYFQYETAIVVFSIPANSNISRFLLGKPSYAVWELSRLWAPDGHRMNLLTEAIACAVKLLRKQEPLCEALVSYADPNVGHEGRVYKAASWILHGKCEESRYYVSMTGQVVSRRKFHSGKRLLKKAEIEAMGYKALKRPGRWRFVRPLTKSARRQVMGHEGALLRAADAVAVTK